MNKHTPQEILHESHKDIIDGKAFLSNDKIREAGERGILPPHEPEPQWIWQHWRKQAAFAEKFCYGRPHSSGQP